jgi:transcriptional regulator of acetoin/glycerol metabolism
VPGATAGSVGSGLWAANPPARSDSTRLENVALDAMAQALRNTGGNVSVAAKLLGVSRNTIYRKKALLPADVWG